MEGAGQSDRVRLGHRKVRQREALGKLYSPPSCSSTVAAGILPAVAPGVPPGGPPGLDGLKYYRSRLKPGRWTWRQDAALYGRRDARRYKRAAIRRGCDVALCGTNLRHRRLVIRNGTGRLTHRPGCGLPIRDTADWQSALPSGVPRTGSPLCRRLATGGVVAAQNRQGWFETFVAFADWPSAISRF
jgi:hypothetical protein